MADEPKELTEEELLILEGTDLSELDAANCSGATLDRMAANCSGATLARMAANCSGATLDRIREIRDAIPTIDRPYKTILEAINAEGCSLEMGSWHQCKTTHCLGGWTVTLAGQAGSELEERFDTEVAARAILRKSRPDAPLPNFYASNAAAMAFIKARAAEEV